MTRFEHRRVRKSDHDEAASHNVAARTASPVIAFVAASILCLFAASAFGGTAQPLPVSDGNATLLHWWTFARVILLAGFLFATVASFKLPGTGIAEGIAFILLAALVTPALMNGEARWYEVLIVLIGLGLVCVEIFILPGFGATGVAGLVLLAVGFVMIFLPAASPTGTVSLDDLFTALLIVVGGAVLGLLSFGWMSSRFPHFAGRNKLVLTETNAAPMPSERWPTVGDVGIASTDLKPGGMVQLPVADGTTRRIDVVSNRGFVPAGASIIVTEIVGQVITVRPVPTAAATSPSQNAPAERSV